MNTDPHPELAVGSDVALVRRMLLIDNQGDLILSPLIETIQIRHFSPEQIFHEFELSRISLVTGYASSLQLNTDLFLLLISHGDVFEGAHRPELQTTIPEICKACHLNIPGVLDSGNMQSLLQTILSYSRVNFPLPNSEPLVLMPTSWVDESRVVIEWKDNHDTWQMLETLWSQETP